jgi:hypothetical protein
MGQEELQRREPEKFTPFSSSNEQPKAVTSCRESSVK